MCIRDRTIIFHNHIFGSKFNFNFFGVTGAMVNEEKICRVLDYFFEMEIIDDNGDLFTVANDYAQDDQLSLYLENNFVQYL